MEMIGHYHEGKTGCMVLILLLPKHVDRYFWPRANGRSKGFVALGLCYHVIDAIAFAVSANSRFGGSFGVHLVVPTEHGPASLE